MKKLIPVFLFLFLASPALAQVRTVGTPISIGTSDIADGAVTTAKIAADAVTAPKIATDAVGSDEIAAGAVGSSEIATDGVGTAEIAADAVGASEIAASSVEVSELGSYFKSETDDGSSGTADTIDFTATAYHLSTLTGNVTYTFTDPAVVLHVTLEICQDAIGSRTAAFPANVRWAGGVTPTITATASKCDLVSCVFRPTPISYVCSIVQDYSY